MRDLFGAAGAWGQCAPAALILRGRPALNFTVRRHVDSGAVLLLSCFCRRHSLHERRRTPP